MLIFRLAYKNLISAKLRTCLNVGVLSFIYVIVIWHQGLFKGMYSQSSHYIIEDEIGGGQYWHNRYDPYDPLALEDSHGPTPEILNKSIQHKKAAPILIRQASIYPGGRIQPVIIRGIDPEQSILNITTSELNGDYDGFLPIMIGPLMAKRNNWTTGDMIVIRWRDINGTFDAIDGKIKTIMNTNVPQIDIGTLWIPLNRMQEMYGLKNEATMIVVEQGTKQHFDINEWDFKDHKYLLKEIDEFVKAKSGSSFILYLILLSLSLMAIFDTQVLSLFRRKKEIGTLMALGLERSKVIALFTLEGAMNGILGMIVGAIYGIPVLIFTSIKGIPMPDGLSQSGYATSSRLLGEYSVLLILGTISFIMLSVIFVSYLPSRKISGLSPTEALKGNLT